VVEEVDGSKPLAPVTAKSGLESYLNGLLLAKNGEILPQWKALHTWMMQNDTFAPVVQALFEAAFGGFSGEYLEADVARLLYGSVLTNSVTRLELFAKCAYAHFLEYGLKLSEREEYSFAAIDMGSMFHDILQRYCNRLEESYDWFTITPDVQEELLHASMEEAVLTMPNESLFESARGAYVLERIYRIMKRSIWALTEQIRRGTFKPVGYEVDFMEVNHLEVEDMTLTEQQKMRLVGRIDRMDTYETEHEIYVKVIDYKSGHTTFQLLNLYYGQQLQLVVYLNAAMEKLKKEHPDKEILPAGIFYYRLDDPMIEGANQSEEEIMEGILSQLRLNGLVSLEPEAYTHMDVGLSGKSDVIPLTLKKDGTVSSRGTTGAGREDFSNLSTFVNTRIRKAAEEILKGNINVRPYELDGNTGCDYCAYRSVCGFDVKIPGYTYDRKEKLSPEDIWGSIRQEIEQGEV
jgi:ATP-dependent helicase/nuclease subunit B